MLILLCTILHSESQVVLTNSKYNNELIARRLPRQVRFALRAINDTLQTITDIEILQNTSVKIVPNKNEIVDLELSNYYFPYNGTICDTMKIFVNAPGFHADTFLYYKKCHFNPYSIYTSIYITPKTKEINKIVVLEDEVDVYVNGKKHSYSVKELGRESNNTKENAKMLFKIPHFTLKGNIIYIEQHPVRIIFMNGKIAYQALDVNCELLRELQNLAHKEIIE